MAEQLPPTPLLLRSVIEPMIRKYFQVFGFILILAGIVTQLAYRQYLDFLDHGLISIPVFLILTGLLIFLISVCGCCGSLAEHHCLTSTYSWVLGTLFLLQLIVGLIIFNMQSQVGPLRFYFLEATSSPVIALPYTAIIK